MTEAVRVNVEWGLMWTDGFVDGPLESRAQAIEIQDDGDTLVSRIAATPWEVDLD